MNAAETSRLLSVVEAEAAGANRLLIWGQRADDTLAVRIADRRICWAASPRAPRRLMDVLRDRGALHLDVCTADELFKLCQRRGVYLGEFLVSRGLVPEATFLDCLLEHIAETFRHSVLAPVAPLAIDYDRTPSHRIPVSVLRRRLAAGAATGASHPVTAQL